MLVLTTMSVAIPIFRSTVRQSFALPAYKTKTFPTDVRKVKHEYYTVMLDNTYTPFSPPTR